MRGGLGAIVLACLATLPLAAQSQRAVVRERQEYAEWLRVSPESPLPPALREGFRPAWHPYDSGPVFLTRMQPLAAPASAMRVNSEGVLVRTTGIGTVLLSLAGELVRLTVHRLDLEGMNPLYEIHLRDGSNGTTTHGTGRFVDLIPLGGNRFLIDLNRARLPWCAYTTTVACPAPWPGDGLTAALPVGEYLPEPIIP